MLKGPQAKPYSSQHFCVWPRSRWDERAFQSYKLLGKNVEQIVCVFAEDRRSLAFKRMPRLSPSTKYYTTYMPGRHGSTVGNAIPLAEVKRCGFTYWPRASDSWFHGKVLTGWGTQLKANSTLWTFLGSASSSYTSKCAVMKNTSIRCTAWLTRTKNRLLWIK